MSYFISLIGTCRSICMRALSFNGAVCKMDTRKEDLESGESRGVALPDCRSGKNREGVRSVIQHRADSSFFFIFPVSPSSFFRREHSLCPRPLPLLVSRRRMSFRNERHGFLSFSTPQTCDKSSSRESRRTSREKNALEISFAGQFIEERKQCRVIDENAQRFDLAERSFDAL